MRTGKVVPHIFSSVADVAGGKGDRYETS